MAVKWIGDVAEELGMDVLDAVEFLASKGNYPMNGLLDEERVQFLKLGKAPNRMESTNPIAVAPAAAAEEKPARRGKGEKGPPPPPAPPAEQSAAERDGVTGPITPPARDKAEERTVIIHNPMEQVG